MSKPHSRLAQNRGARCHQAERDQVLFGVREDAVGDRQDDDLVIDEFQDHCHGVLVKVLAEAAIGHSPHWCSPEWSRRRSGIVLGSFIGMLGGRRLRCEEPACLTKGAGAGAVVRVAALGAVPLPSVKAKTIMTTVLTYTLR